MTTDFRIDYVEFPAADLDAAQAFYSGAFGWSFTSYGPEYSCFSDERLGGGFYKSDLRSTTTAGAALIVLHADDLEATQAAVLSNGGTIAKPIFPFPGGRRFHFLDPHGNELAVWSEN